MSRSLNDRQETLLAELMPQIVRALEYADDAARGYRLDESRPHGKRHIDTQPEEGLKRLRELDLGNLLDALNDHCWCEEHHEGKPCTDVSSGLAHVDADREAAKEAHRHAIEEARDRNARELAEQHAIDAHLDRERGLDQ